MRRLFFNLFGLSSFSQFQFWLAQVDSVHHTLFTFRSKPVVKCHKEIPKIGENVFYFSIYPRDDIKLELMPVKLITGNLGLQAATVCFRKTRVLRILTKVSALQIARGKQPRCTTWGSRKRWRQRRACQCSRPRSTRHRSSSEDSSRCCPTAHPHRPPRSRRSMRSRIRKQRWRVNSEN